MSYRLQALHGSPNWVLDLLIIDELSLEHLKIHYEADETIVVFKNWVIPMFITRNNFSNFFFLFSTLNLKGDQNMIDNVSIHQGTCTKTLFQLGHHFHICTWHFNCSFKTWRSFFEKIRWFWLCHFAIFECQRRVPKRKAKY